MLAPMTGWVVPPPQAAPGKATSKVLNAKAWASTPTGPVPEGMYTLENVSSLLAGLGLSLIMEATGSVWLLIPTGIILGNGYLFAFYAITNWWNGWSYFWPLEPLLVGGAIYYTIKLVERRDEAPETVRGIARALRRPTFITTGLVALLGMILG